MENNKQLIKEFNEGLIKINDTLVNSLNINSKTQLVKILTEIESYFKLDLQNKLEYNLNFIEKSILESFQYGIDRVGTEYLNKIEGPIIEHQINDKLIIEMEEKTRAIINFINNLSDPMYSTSFIDFRQRVANQVLLDLNKRNENNRFLYFESSVIKNQLDNYLNKFLVSTFKMSESNLINHIKKLREINEHINISEKLFDENHHLEKTENRKKLESLFNTNEEQNKNSREDLEKLFDYNEIDKAHIKIK